MVTKDPSRKQIIIPIEINNAERVIAQSNMYITNINRLLKDVKSEISTDFIYLSNKGIVITTNKVAISLDLNIIENYIKELNNINTSNVMSLRLSQSKLYLKILDILYFVKDTNLFIISDIIESNQNFPYF